MTDEVMDPQELARSVAVETSERTDAVGDFVTSIELEDGVTDFRFKCNLVGYEGWQWSVTLYHDTELQRWTVNESTLIPTDDSLLPPPWIPWKDRLKPSDLSVMDSIGTDENDARLEDGFRPVHHISEENSEENSKEETSENSEENTEKNSKEETKESAETQESQETQESEESNSENDFDEDLEEAVSSLRLSRRRVMTAEALSQTAKRWYSGQHGPKSLSTKIADGKACSSCGFLIPLAGSLGSMFGVCANMWSPDDGRVVSLDHACGEHSDIDPPEPSQLWVQSAPAYDDYHIDIIQQAPREERADVELIEEAIEDSKTHRRKRRKLEDASDSSKEDLQPKANDINDENDTSNIEESDKSYSLDSLDSTDNLYDSNKAVESKEVNASVEESNQEDATTKTVGSTTMHLYKRKSRRQHK